MTCNNKIAIKVHNYYMDIKEIIERISYFRNESKLSARELSLRIFKNETYINRLEYLNFNLPVTVLMEIIDALGITPDEFFAKDYKNYSKKEKLLNLLTDLISDLPKNKLDNLIDFIKSQK